MWLLSPVGSPGPVPSLVPRPSVQTVYQDHVGVPGCKWLPAPPGPVYLQHSVAGVSGADAGGPPSSLGDGVETMRRRKAAKGMAATEEEETVGLFTCDIEGN